MQTLTLTVNISTAEVHFHVPSPSSWFSPSTLLFQLESTSHLCGSQRGGTSGFLKDHCAFLPLTAVALCWPRWMKKPWRLLTASNGACCKQTASGVHSNVMMQRLSAKSSSQFCFQVSGDKWQMTRGNAASVFNNLITLHNTLVQCCSHCQNLFPNLEISASLFQPLSAVRHTIRSTNKQARAERTRSEINCKWTESQKPSPRPPPPPATSQSCHWSTWLFSLIVVQQLVWGSSH